MRRWNSLWLVVALGLILTIRPACALQQLRIGTYNVESYLDVPAQTRPAKSPESKAKVLESILAMQPDVLALQEMGSTSALLELRDSLKRERLDLPHWLLVSGRDTNIHIGLLSKFPFSAVRLYTNENFLLNGRRFHVSRGFAEVTISAGSNFCFTLFAAHLKSKRSLAEGDEAELRLEEAKLLREKIDARLASDPEANLVVLGDFNDTKDADSTRAILGRGKTRLVDTRPEEKNGDDGFKLSGADRRCVTWTHYFNREDSYRRIDYLLLSRHMARNWDPEQTQIITVPGWGVGSDHRPIVACFRLPQ